MRPWHRRAPPAATVPHVLTVPAACSRPVWVVEPVPDGISLPEEIAAALSRLDGPGHVLQTRP